MTFQPLRSTQTDKDSPGSPSVFGKFSSNLDAVHQAIVGTGRTVTLSGAPANDTSGVIEIVGSMTTGEYNGFTLFVDDEDSAAYGKSWKIDTTGTNNVSIATGGVNLFTEGLRDADSASLIFNIINTAGTKVNVHTHNGTNSAIAIIPDALWYTLMYDE